jgi:hypothetical protein
MIKSFNDQESATFLVGKILFSLKRPDQLFGPSILLPRKKGTETFTLILTISKQYRNSEFVELYLHSSICLHGTFINKAHG